jgi:serine/threonine-protein kinase PpkA
MSTFSNYTIIKSLGKGGQAEVFLATDNRFLSKVAIKILSTELCLNPNMSQRFIAEARNMFQMSHQNIIRVTDLIEEDGKKAFVMEYIEGNNLRDEVERLGTLSSADIHVWMSQIFSAVGYCHAQGLVHRDIKPSNFMITKEGLIKLLDFGIAKNTASNAEYTQTSTAQMMGTPLYMSPEQILETKNVDARSDIYSLGVLLWQLVTGKKPYDSQTLSAYQIQTKIVNEPLPTTGSIFDELISKCSAKDPEKRFHNCSEAQQALDKLFNGSAVASLEDKTVVSHVDADDKTSIVSNLQPKPAQSVIPERKHHSSSTSASAESYHKPEKKSFSKKFILISIASVLGVFTVSTVIYFLSVESSAIGNWSQSDKEALINDLESELIKDSSSRLYRNKSEFIDCVLSKFENSYSSYETLILDSTSNFSNEVISRCEFEILSDSLK